MGWPTRAAALAGYYVVLTLSAALAQCPYHNILKRLLHISTLLDRLIKICCRFVPAVLVPGLEKWYWYRRPVRVLHNPWNPDDLTHARWTV